MLRLQLYSFAILGILILFIAGIFVRSKAAAVVCGLIGSALIAFQCLVIVALMGWGQAWRGSSEGSWIPYAWGFGGIIAIVVYFIVTFARLEDD